MPVLQRTLLSLALLSGFLLLNGCGDLPRPFAGNPGANAIRLSHPPPAKLVVTWRTPSPLCTHDIEAATGDFTAGLVAREIPAFAHAAAPGDWQAQLALQASGGNSAITATLIDGDGKARGDVKSFAFPTPPSCGGGTAGLHPAIASLAAPFDDLLHAVEAGIAQNDPSSLDNRPVQIFLADVVGAPGDGNRSLFAAMRQHLLQSGDLVVNSPGNADFVVAGTIKRTHVDVHTDQIEIHWHVANFQFKEAGDVAQGHDFPAGALDHYWGEVATAVADEAAPGVNTIITNFSGRRPKSPAIKTAGDHAS